MVALPPLALVLVANGAVLLGLAGLAWRRRHKPGARLFAAVLVLAAVYALGYAGELAAGTAGGHLLWVKVQYLGITVLPVTVLVFALDYTGRDWLVTPGVVAAISAVPLVSLALVLTEPAHGYFIRVEGVRTLADPLADTVRLATYDLGPAYWIELGYEYLLYLVTVVLVVEFGVRQHRLYRDQTALLFVALVVPLGLELLAMAVLPVAFDLAPFAYTITGGLIVWGIYRARLLDVVPVDRKVLFERTPGAVLVIDATGRVVDANGTATATLDGAALVGEPVDPLLAAAGFQVSLADLDDGMEVTCDRADRTRHYEVRLETVETRLGDVRGRLLMLYDVTERRAVEADLRRKNDQLAILNRLLRHDIRNDVAVALGWGEQLARELDDEGREDLASMAETVVSANRHVEELTGVASDLAESLTGDEELALRPVEVVTVLAETVRKARVRYPSAEFEEPDEYPGATVRANEMLSSVFTNLLNNAVQHNDREDARVEVGATVEDDTVRVTVADNGPGVSDETKRSVFGRGEKGLGSSGAGLGLYLVDRLVDAFGGRVEVRDNDPRGAVFVVELPVADAPVDTAPTDEAAA